MPRLKGSYFPKAEQRSSFSFQPEQLLMLKARLHVTKCGRDRRLRQSWGSATTWASSADKCVNPKTADAVKTRSAGVSSKVADKLRLRHVCYCSYDSDSGPACGRPSQLTPVGPCPQEGGSKMSSAMFSGSKTSSNTSRDSCRLSNLSKTTDKVG